MVSVLERKLKGLKSLVFGTLVLSSGCATELNRIKLEREFSPEDYRKIISPFYEVCKIKYTAEIEKEDYWQSPSETRKLGTGDCEDMALDLVDLWEKKGVRGSIVIGYCPIRMPRYLHAWNEVNWNGKTYVFDVVNRAAFEKGKDPDRAHYELLSAEHYESMIKKMKEYANRNGFTNNDFNVSFKLIKEK